MVITKGEGGRRVCGHKVSGVEEKKLRRWLSNPRMDPTVKGLKMVNFRLCLFYHHGSAKVEVGRMSIQPLVFNQKSFSSEWSRSGGVCVTAPAPQYHEDNWAGSEPGF